MEMWKCMGVEVVGVEVWKCVGCGGMVWVRHEDKSVQIGCGVKKEWCVDIHLGMEVHVGECVGMRETDVRV